MIKELEVQIILREWFKKMEFEVIENVILDAGNKVDLIAKKDNEKWIVEIKGDYNNSTAQYNVNFDTGMGQILKSISTVIEGINYAICIPISSTEQGRKLSYRRILKKYSKSRVFELLNIHMILVGDDKSVEIIDPKDVTSFIDTIDPTIKKW